MNKLPLTSRLSIGSLLAGTTALVVALTSAVLPPGRGYWIAGLTFLSFYLVHRALRRLTSQAAEQRRRAQQMSDLHLASMAALALAIAAREDGGPTRLRRMHAYAAGLARALGLSAEEIRGVKAAALLHDVGTLAVPEDLLWKQVPLAPEELHRMRMHPRAGADIASGVPFPYPVASLILSHHERWDGGGYPDGLAGHQIPLGARILSAAEHFAALESEPSMTPKAALERLQEERGQALDPAVVDAFVRAYPIIESEVQALGPEAMHSARVSPPSAGVTSTPSEWLPYSRTLHDIFLAHREVHALHEIAREMSRGLAVSDRMTLLSNKLSALVPLSSCALFVTGREPGTLACRCAIGVDADAIYRLTMRDGQWSAQWASESRRPDGGTAAKANLEATDMAAARTVLASALVYPIVFDERFVGMLAVYHTDAGIYTSEHGRLLGRVSEHAAAMIYHSIVFEQAQEDSLRDPLTGLPNARYLIAHLARELARAGRQRSMVALLLLDLDGFKDINDTHGHHVGDDALRETATALQGVIRPYDVCVRYAGDEFVVVLPGCGRDEAERRRLDLQKAIDEVRFEIAPGRRLALAISVGLAVFPQDGASREELLAEADRGMYGTRRAASGTEWLRRERHAHADHVERESIVVGARGRNTRRTEGPPSGGPSRSG